MNFFRLIKHVEAIRGLGIILLLSLAASHVNAALLSGASGVNCFLGQGIEQWSTTSIPYPYYGTRYNLSILHFHKEYDVDGVVQLTHRLPHSSQLQLPNRVQRPLSIKVRHQHIYLPGKYWRSQADHSGLRCSGNFWRELPDKATLQDGCGQDRSRP